MHPLDPALTPLDLGEIRPRGWLLGQLRRQVEGMAGHLDEFWPDIRDSAWIGGPGDGWERGPYWLDGVIPLAYLTDDAQLQRKVRAWVDYILDHQADDGWLGPVSADPDPKHEASFGPVDVWPRMILLKALLQYHSATGDDRVVGACVRLGHRIGAVLEKHPLHEWGRVRWADLAMSLIDLYRFGGDEGLLSVAELAHRQGYDWEDFTTSFRYPERVPRARLERYEAESGGLWMNDDFLATHGANVAMGVKAIPVRAAMTGDPALRDLFHLLLERLDRFHGQATGVFGSDEHLAGRNPSQGTETCTIVEFMFSLEVALQQWGPDEAVIDRLERIAFNALPASSRSDEWGHQYDQQANQVIAHVCEDRIYTTNPPDSNVFALEPSFGCCTANRHQGWPKFAARLWMRSGADALTALSYAPCVIDTEVGGTDLHVEVRSEYPFRDTVSIEVRAARPVEATLQLRIPGWAIEPTVAIDGGEPEALTPGTMHSLRQTWREHRIELTWAAAIELEERYSDALSVRRGPVVFSAAVAEDWRAIGGEWPHETWEVHPASPWNRGVFRRAEGQLAGDLEIRSVGDEPFTPEGAPLAIRAEGFEIPAWGLAHGAAQAPPPSPVEGIGASVPIELLPYGSARLRVTEIPWAPRAPGV